jgi:hypothetical protein
MRRILTTWRGLLAVSPFAASLSLLLIASVALNVVLAMRLRQSATQRASTVQGLAAGQAIPALVGEIRSGDALRPHRYEPRGSQGTLLYVSAAQCRWSQQNLPLFIDLAQQARGRYRVVTIDLTPGLKPGEPSHLDTVPDALVLRNLAAESREVLRVQGTPETFLLSPDGKVVKVWLGAFVDDKMKQELSAYLNGSSKPSR